MSALSKYIPSAPPPPPVVLARGDAFFVRRVALAEGEPIDAQVVLALEGMAPFPPEQLYYGYLPSPDGKSALVFSAFRRRFEAVDTEGWDGAALVTPEFVAWFHVRPAGSGFSVWAGEGRVTAIAWTEGEQLPTSVLVRAGGSEAVDGVLAELRARTGLGYDAEVVSLPVAPILRVAGEGNFEVVADDRVVGVLPASWGTGADVRDPDFLAARRRAAVRDLWLWRGLVGAAAVLVLAAMLHLGAGAFSLLTGQRVRLVTEQKPVVAQIDAVQALSNRIHELSEKRLMPFEMLEVINPARPDTVVFQRLQTKGLLGLEVEAQSSNADDVGSYAKALKVVPSIASVQTSAVRVREGVTSFVLSLEFNADALRKGGAL